MTREQALGLGLSRHALTRLLGAESWRPLARGLVAHQVAANLALRGWTGLLDPCPRCRAITVVDLTA